MKIKKSIGIFLLELGESLKASFYFKRVSRRLAEPLDQRILIPHATKTPAHAFFVILSYAR